MRLTWVLLIIGILLSANAFALTVTSQIVSNQIFRDETADFKLTLTNNDSFAQTFVIISADPVWKTFMTSTVDLKAGESKVVNVGLDPANTIGDGKIYGVPINIQSQQTKVITTVQIDVQINSERFRTYAPSIVVDVVVGDNNQVDPTKPFSMVLKLINKNSLAIKPLIVQVSSPLFSDQFVLNLNGSDYIVINRTYRVDAKTKPEKVRLNVRMEANNLSLGSPTTQTVEIRSVAPAFERTVVVDDQSFLRHEYVVKLVNTGNVVSQETIKLESNILHRFITRSNVDPLYVEENGKSYLAFDVSLNPGSGIELNVTSNYRPFFYTVVTLVALLIAGIVLYFVFRSAIIINRKYVPLGKDGEGVTKIKVVINLRNRTSKLIENVRVIERTPTITEVENNFAIGSIKPSKILSNNNKGTLVRWDFATLEPYEERIITYTIRSKLVILGGGHIKLPPTMVKYDSYGHTRTVSEKSILHKAAGHEDDD